MLALIIPLLSRMTYAELKDFIDYCEFYHLAELMNPSIHKYQFRKAIRGRRMGLESGGLPYAEGDGSLDSEYRRDFRGLEMTTVTQQQALEFIETLSPKEKTSVLTMLFSFSDEQRDSAIAWALLREKAPIRRFARGNIQVKWLEVKKAVVKDEEGKEKAVRVIAPYLYYRYSTIQGNTDRKETRYKSVYIRPKDNAKLGRKGGYTYRQLATLFDGLVKEHGIPKQWTDPKTGETKINKIRPAGDDNPIAKLERMIMRCMAWEGDELKIDHNRLERLQHLLCGYA